MITNDKLGQVIRALVKELGIGTDTTSELERLKEQNAQLRRTVEKIAAHEKELITKLYLAQNK